MGAGHPRLSFELEAFTANLPPHFIVDADYRARKNPAEAFELWLAGQLQAAMSDLNGIMTNVMALLDGAPDVDVALLVTFFFGSSKVITVLLQDALRCSYGDLLRFLGTFAMLSSMNMSVEQTCHAMEFRSETTALARRLHCQVSPPASRRLTSASRRCAC